jgi:hypothetical protein
LREKPPTGPTIGSATEAGPPLPWANREAVLRRDAEIRALREETQHARGPPLPFPKGDDAREPV